MDVDARPAQGFVVVCEGGERTRLQVRAPQAPGPGELLLRLNVVGFCGTDLFKLKTGSARPGSVLGHELVGTLIQSGPGVCDFSEGDRIVVPHHVPCGRCVFCRRGNETMCEVFKENLMEPGGFADTILIRARATEFAARKVPDAISDEKAVFVEPAACVLRGIQRSGIEDGAAAVVLGAGSMGLLHLLVLRALFPNLAVVIVDPDEARLTLAGELGAAGALAPGQAVETFIAKITGGIGVDAVFDTVGGERTLRAGLEFSRAGGSVVVFAHAPEGTAAGFDLNAFFKSERRVIATYSGALKEQAAIFDLIVSGALDPSPLVTHTLPLDDFDRGVALVVERKALKVLFTPSRASGFA